MHYAYYEWEANRRQREIIRGTTRHQGWRTDTVPLGQVSRRAWSGMWLLLQGKAKNSSAAVPSAQPYVAVRTPAAPPRKSQDRAS